jgi:hypothetical protein
VHVNPPPKSHRLGIDARAEAAPEQGYERNPARAGIIEACGLGSARIYRRHGQILGDVAERMGVADRKVIQPSLNACISPNGKVRLIPLDVECAAVNATDS